MDITKPYFNGIVAAVQIHKDHFEIKITGVSMPLSKHFFIQGIFNLGAFDYLLKEVKLNNNNN